MEEVARYECVYNRGRKDFKDKNKRPTVGTKSGRSFNYRPGKRRPNKNCVRSLSKPKPMFSTVLELTTTRFMTKRRVCLRQNFCSSTFAILFAFQPTRACIFDISAHQNVWLRSALRSLQLYGNSLFLRSSAIVCDLRSTAIIWKPAFR